MRKEVRPSTAVVTSRVVKLRPSRSRATLCTDGNRAWAGRRK